MISIITNAPARATLGLESLELRRLHHDLLLHIKYYLTECILTMTQCSQSAWKQGPGVINGNYATNIVQLINIIKYFFAQRVVWAVE